MSNAYPKLRAKLVQPGAIIVDVQLIPGEGEEPILLIQGQAVQTVEEAHELIRPIANEHGIPAERVEIDTEHLDP